MRNVKGLTLAALSLAVPLAYGAGVSVAVSNDALDAAYTLSPIGQHGSAELRRIKTFNNAPVTLRYGSVEVDTDRYGDKTVDDGFKLGLKLRF